MWFFMILCYILSLFSAAAMILTGIQGYFAFNIFQANHATFAILTLLIYLFTQTLIIFYFVGIGVSIKEFMLEQKISGEFHKEIIKIKRKIYPPILLNILLFMMLSISGGAVDTHRIPGGVHSALFLMTSFHFFYVLLIEHFAFKDSTRIVLQMANGKK